MENINKPKFVQPPQIEDKSDMIAILSKSLKSVNLALAQISPQSPQYAKSLKTKAGIEARILELQAGQEEQNVTPKTDDSWTGYES
jgi:hypothetical protein